MSMSTPKRPYRKLNEVQKEKMRARAAAQYQRRVALLKALKDLLPSRKIPS